MELWIWPALVLALGNCLDDSYAAWGPSGCAAAPVAVATYATQDGWYESADYPGWWVRYERGRVAEWEKMPAKGVVPAPAKGAVPQVDKDSVLRRGNLAEHIDGTIRNPAVTLWGQLSGPPASDADKWTIAVISMQRCPTCAKLKQDWASDPELRAFAKPELQNQKESWSHFQWYDKADATQQHQWKDLKVTAYPTVIVSPPRTGDYGSPKTVVFQQVYGRGSTPQQLARDIRDAITRYAARYSPTRAADEEAMLPESGAIAAPPPVAVKPKADLSIDQSILPANPTDHLRIPPAKPSPSPPLSPEGGTAVLAALASIVGALCCFSVFGVFAVALVVMLLRGKTQAPAYVPPPIYTGPGTVPQQITQPVQAKAPATAEDQLEEAVVRFASTCEQRREVAARQLAAEEKVRQTMLKFATADAKESKP